jgi:hypothetical protein
MKTDKGHPEYFLVFNGDLGKGGTICKEILFNHAIGTWNNPIGVENRRNLREYPGA